MWELLPDRLYDPPVPVAITGLGIVSALAAGVAATRAALREGRSGLRTAAALDLPLAAPVPLGVVPDGTLPARTGRQRAPDRGRALLEIAAREAVASSGLEPRALPPGRVIVGTTLGGMETGTALYRAAREGRPVARARLRDYLPGDQVARAAEKLGLPGPATAVADACASGATAIGLAFRAVRTGAVPWALAGGYDPLCAFVVAGFSSLQAVSPEPCRPFDRRRRGLSLGEGAALLVLEDEAAARARGARVLGRVLGYGAASDAHHLTQPDPSGAGAARAMRAALADADVAPGDLAWVKAHATATVPNDRMEATALRAALGDAAGHVPVVGLKPLVGHTLGGAGAVELALALCASAEGILPPTLGLEEPDPACEGLDLPRGAFRAFHGGPILCNAFGFGGLDASLVVQGRVSP